MAGATFASDHGVDDPPKMTGSWFLLREETLEKARERLSKDIYVRGGAWDMNRVSSESFVFFWFFGVGGRLIVHCGG